jgi:adenylate kinase family enzyme
MKRILVIGSGGAGKSTLSRELGEILGIPVVHLDSVYWRPGWEETPKDEWGSKVEELIREDSWIMDGNFGGTREMRMRAADTIIFLDLPRLVCTSGVLKRWAKYYGKTRPDMAQGCNEHFSLELLQWVWNYPARSRVGLMNELAKAPEKNIIILKSRGAMKEFVDEQRRANR